MSLDIETPKETEEKRPPMTAKDVILSILCVIVLIVALSCSMDYLTPRHGSDIAVCFLLFFIWAVSYVPELGKKEANFKIMKSPKWKVIKVILIVLSCVAFLVVSVIDIPFFRQKPISKDYARLYFEEINYYVEQSGDTSIYDELLDYMDERQIDEYTERIGESYGNGYQDAYNELEDSGEYATGYDDGYDEISQ